MVGLKGGKETRENRNNQRVSEAGMRREWLQV